MDPLLASLHQPTVKGYWLLVSTVHKTKKWLCLVSFAVMVYMNDFWVSYYYYINDLLWLTNPTNPELLRSANYNPRDLTSLCWSLEIYKDSTYSPGKFRLFKIQEKSHSSPIPLNCLLPAMVPDFVPLGPYFLLVPKTIPKCSMYEIPTYIWLKFYGKWVVKDSIPMGHFFLICIDILCIPASCLVFQ